MNKISKFLQTKIDAGDFPSAVYLVAEKGEMKFQDALGFAVVKPEKIKANLDTIYDLASLTKVLVTGLLCAKLIEDGEINLSDKISMFFPEFDTDEKREITIRNLLTHTSGFKAWIPFYLNTKLKSKISDIIATEPLENSINEKVVYSDLNFLMLGFLIEKIFGKPLSEVSKDELFQSLSLRKTFFSPARKLRQSIAASEFGNFYERQVSIDLGYDLKIRDPRDYKMWNELGYDVPNYGWRDYQIWGDVHDANSRFLNGVSGHAGLFSDVSDTFNIAQQFLPETTKILKPETCELFRTNFTLNLNQARSIAFQLAETEGSTASEALSKNSFGHLGFTGTSLWIEPSKERIFILLTNRTHNRELPFADLKETRQNFHRLAVEFLENN